jgi:hypothetical protein
VVQTAATDGDGAVSDSSSDIGEAIGDAMMDGVTMVENLATVVNPAAGSTADLTPEIAADVTPVGDMGGVTAAAIVETITGAAGVMTDAVTEATTSTQATTQTAVREASAIVVESPAAIVDAAADATWATFETVATEASATVPDVASLETVKDTRPTTADATTTVSHASSEVLTGVEEVLAYSDLASQTIVDSTTTTSDAATHVTTLLGHTANEAQATLAEAAAEATPEAAVTIADAMTEAASAAIVAVGGDGGLADPTAVLNEATVTVVSALDPASRGSVDDASEDASSGPETFGEAGSIQGEHSPMRNERLRFSMDRIRSEGERFQGTEPVAPCEDPSSLNCALTRGADGIDSLVESVASIIKILALTGLTLLPWLAAAGMLVFLGGVALAASRRRRATCSLRNGTLPPGSHVKDVWAYS